MNVRKDQLKASWRSELEDPNSLVNDLTNKIFTVKLILFLDSGE